MQSMMQGLRRSLRGLPLGTKGQDLIEYALVLALIALAATAAMSSVAQKINQALTNVGTKLITYTS